MEPRDHGLEYEEDVRPQPRLTRPCAAWRRESRRLPVNRGEITTRSGRHQTSGGSWQRQNRPRRSATKPQSDGLLGHRPPCKRRVHPPAQPVPRLPALIFELDGSLEPGRHRRHLDHRRPRFFEHIALLPEVAASNPSAARLELSVAEAQTLIDRSPKGLRL